MVAPASVIDESRTFDQSLLSQVIYLGVLFVLDSLKGLFHFLLHSFMRMCAGGNVF